MLVTASKTIKSKYGQFDVSIPTDKVIEKANEWQSRLLDKIYPIIFMDATVLKIRVSSKEYSYIYNAYTRR